MNDEAGSRITVYRPNQRHELGLLRTWVVMAENVIRSRELIWQLFKRDFTAAYKKSFIGITWVFIMPLFGIIHWVLLKRTNILRPGDMPGGIPYTVYVLVGTSMWGLFLNLFTSAGNTLSAGKALIMQVNYSHEVLLFQQAAQCLANFCIGFVMNIAVLLAFGICPSWKIVLLPFVLLPLFLLASAMGLVLSMFAIVAVDLTRLATRGMVLLMMFTPVIYVATSPDALAAAANVTWWDKFLCYVNLWNPLTYLVCSARDIVLSGKLYDNLGFAVCAAGSVILLLVSWRLFFVSEDKIVERMI